MVYKPLLYCYMKVCTSLLEKEITFETWNDWIKGKVSTVELHSRETKSIKIDATEREREREKDAEEKGKQSSSWPRNPNFKVKNSRSSKRWFWRRRRRTESQRSTKRVLRLLSFNLLMPPFQRPHLYRVSFQFSLCLFNFKFLSSGLLNHWLELWSYIFLSLYYLKINGFFFIYFRYVV